MFPQSPQANNGFTTSTALQQNNSLLGNPQFQSGGAQPTMDAGVLNSTAPQSSTTNPAVANMVHALKGGM